MLSSILMVRHSIFILLGVGILLLFRHILLYYTSSPFFNIGGDFLFICSYSFFAEIFGRLKNVLYICVIKIRNMKEYWRKINNAFIFENEKLEVSLSVDNPVYGKRLCVYLINGKETILVYDGTERDYGDWVHYNSKIEEDVINMLDGKLKEQEYKEKQLLDKQKEKQLIEENRIKNIINSY